MHELNIKRRTNRHECNRCKHEYKSMEEEPCKKCLSEQKCCFEERGEEK